MRLLTYCVWFHSRQHCSVDLHRGDPWWVHDSSYTIKTLMNVLISSLNTFNSQRWICFDSFWSEISPPHTVPALESKALKTFWIISPRKIEHSTTMCQTHVHFGIVSKLSFSSCSDKIWTFTRCLCRMLSGRGCAALSWRGKVTLVSQSTNRGTQWWLKKMEYTICVCMYICCLYKRNSDKEDEKHKF